MLSKPRGLQQASGVKAAVSGELIASRTGRIGKCVDLGKFRLLSYLVYNCVSFFFKLLFMYLFI